MKRKGVLFLVILMGLTAVVAASCAGSAGSPAVAMASLSRVEKLQIPDADLSALSSGNSDFALDLYRELRANQGNLFYSPYSVSLALAMTFAGARGQTEEQMAKVLHFALPQNRLHPALNALDQQLSARGASAKGQDGDGFRLKIANSLWGQDGYRFLPQFLDSLAQNYGAGLRLVDFRSAPEPARVAVNDWVEDQTEDRIQDLLPPGSVTGDTRLVLANAIYFNAAWKHTFAKESTRPRPFHLLDGGQASVPMMSQTQSFGYSQGSGYQAVELPYDGGEISMVIMLPDTGSFRQFEDSLSADVVDAAIDGLQSKRVSLVLPKLSYQSTFQLGDSLAAMGMPDAMRAGQADFSGMSEGRDLFISDVVHKAVVVVDEKGTEAAAATGVVMSTTSAPIDAPVPFVVDRPFVFLIRDVETSSILFVGRVLNPAG